VGSGKGLAADSPTTPSAIGTVHRFMLGFETVATRRRGLADSALAEIEMYCSTLTFTRSATRRSVSIEYSQGPVPSSEVAV